MLALMMAAVLSAQVNETITVSRVLVDVRVTNYGGEPVTDLKPGDFNVRIGGKRAIVESVQWVEDGVIESTSHLDEPLVDAPARKLDVDESMTRRPPRLFVFFVQTDYTRDTLRTEGQMAFLPFARELAESLAVEDRVAVFSYDTHLKFRLDFTNDRQAIREAITNTLWIDFPPPPAPVEGPSLAPHLDREAMRDVAHAETGLLLVANALKPLPGAKTILLLGWGLGEMTEVGVTMKRQWKETKAALDAARVSIFALDTTNSPAHSLETGLRIAAEETGGFYAKTYLFPRVALDRVQRTLAGHYELELRVPDGVDAGSHPIDVRVKKRGVYVLAPGSVLIRR